ncbi:hypothetical protein NQ315_007574 [Exocentrus adspersus]|uniref:Secreted protein n=1 Tax=Exocentrus adspersus TaxID=1586481 RepID=A0AAV8W851_9CUCU|nr:hypothetical protein NQ315_007574 [Exocentrus adspersus]
MNLHKNFVSLTLIGLVFFVVIEETESGVITETVSKVLCKTKHQFHKIKNYIRHHSDDHDENPCKKRHDKNQSGNQASGEESDYLDQTSTTTTTPSPSEADQGNTTSSGKGPGNPRRLINTGANCPDGYRADTSGKCYLSL